ncbi:uncharacterized protein LOC132609331 [Lycium barbarum]|uniref:uncharacterized protein LOC132609331 n=1 Tax=Lycium barbarum TaxID=112863 RepID=UPI00293F144D|nr:uncharacterized protein LOC132609331 [Lycium barbarum]XP_060179228.1 uncharacterized protein LOC132609331 [Lycium barbarum]XP_060179229.1 uncharacterized protein LOC132609331 [Lycium barbarum]XP_060179230.1 uncharacterized protein LOC132609331 [Lycium barbarum]XP_060179231.1 uncharacterized protein LOC132609331 [Lycium barbarum]
MGYFRSSVPTTHSNGATQPDLWPLKSIWKSKAHVSIWKSKAHFLSSLRLNTLSSLWQKTLLHIPGSILVQSRCLCNFLRIWRLQFTRQYVLGLKTSNKLTICLSCY